MLKLKSVSRLMSHVALILFAIFASVIPCHAVPGYISTLAGTALNIGSANGTGPLASFNNPFGITPRTGQTFMWLIPKITPSAR